MRRLIEVGAGLALLVIGTAKAMAHSATLDPMAAYWCRASDLVGSTEPANAMSWFSGHCWGCPVAFLGAALLLLAGLHALRDQGGEPRFSRPV